MLGPHTLLTFVASLLASLLLLFAQEGLLPLHLAAQGGRRRCVEALARAPDARPDASAPLGTTALHLAAVANEADCAETLLALGAAASARNAFARTPLHAAAGTGAADAAAVLLDRRADVAARDSDGATPLHVAAAAGQVECLELLLERGAPREAADNVRPVCRAFCCLLMPIFIMPTRLPSLPFAPLLPTVVKNRAHFACGGVGMCSTAADLLPCRASSALCYSSLSAHQNGENALALAMKAGQSECCRVLRTIHVPVHSAPACRREQQPGGGAAAVHVVQHNTSGSPPHHSTFSSPPPPSPPAYPGAYGEQPATSGPPSPDTVEEATAARRQTSC